MSKFDELVTKLREIFQIDRPELDFGIYRILNARADEINDYLENRLKEKVTEALSAKAKGDTESITKDLIADLRDEYGKRAFDDQGNLVDDEALASDAGKRLQDILSSSKGVADNENAVFSHLLTFFSRYYDQGDFISQRRYKGDTYAIPYAGEEVMLHWANKDQYYIKTGENFSNYSFKLEDGRVVHFRLVAADTAKDNRKDNDKDRLFVLAENRTIVRTDDDGDEYDDEIIPIEELSTTDADGYKSTELVIRFDYKAVSKGTKQDKLISEAVASALELDWVASNWSELASRAPTEKNPKRTLLEKHLINYTAENTADYFIHKNLGKFLRGELDFYIKNEVMNLDDVQDAKAFSDIEKNLRMIQCLRSIASDLITFLAQLENFQKKLWTKKKFVVETNYCFTVDLLPNEMLEEVQCNDKQWVEWHRLGFIEYIEDHNERLNIIRKYSSLTVDTRLFTDVFKWKWLSLQDGIEEKITGTLINSDNFQALNTLSYKYKSSVDGIYIDPPYNTDSAEILYKNGYKDSSWCSLITGRLELAREFLKQDSMLCVTIDEHEVSNLDLLLKEIMPGYKIRPTIIEYNHRGRVKNNFAITHEYGLWAIPDGKDLVTRKEEISEEIRRNLRRTGSGSTRAESESQFYGIEVDNETLDIVNVTFALPNLATKVPEHGNLNTTMIWPIDDQGIERRWYYGRDRVIKEAQEGSVWAKRIKGEIQVHYRQPGKPKMRKSVWTGPKLDASTYGSELLNDLFNVTQINFSFPKSIHAVYDSLDALSRSKNAHFLDFFAGSGTTGHAVLELNKKDQGKRRFTLVEQGTYFDTVTLPRIRKAIYSDRWKYGRSSGENGYKKAIIQYFKLEGYEDSLNNLSLSRSAKQDDVFSDKGGFKDRYLINYLLDFESKKSLIDSSDFISPFDYSMNISTDSAGAYTKTKVDLVETFNLLIGIKVNTVEYQIEQGFVRIEGNLATGEYVLIIWRDCKKIGYEKLKEWENRLNIGAKDNPYDIIYINGDHNLSEIYSPTKEEGGDTSVRVIRSIEPEFLSRMFAEEEI